MDTSPKILFWGLSGQEKDEYNLFLEGISAPGTEVIEPNQGHLLVHEILFSDKKGEEPLDPQEKILLFFNVPAQSIHKVMNEIKRTDLVRPIFAMVTRENITWKFSELVEHLRKEHAFMQKKIKDGKRGKH